MAMPRRIHQGRSSRTWLTTFSIDITVSRPVEPAHRAVTAPTETSPRWPPLAITWRSVPRTAVAACSGSTCAALSMSWRITWWTGIRLSIATMNSSSGKQENRNA